MRTEAPNSDPQAQTGVFATTHWSVVLAAGRKNTPESAEAMEQFCRNYWYPLYAFVRRQGRTPEDAQDLTQAFFGHLLSKDFLGGVGPEKGRFRSFLLASLKHFLADEWARARAAKRGGHCPAISLDLEQAEERYGLEARVETTPETLFERRWALDLLERVLARLEREAAESGRGTMFAALESCLLGGRPTETYSQLGRRLGLSETAVKVAVYRLRQRCREALCQEVALTVTRPEELEAEIRYLLEVVSR